MNRDAKFVSNEIQTAWSAVCAGMQAMYQSTDVWPSSVHEIFHFSNEANDGEVDVDVGPIFFRVPERATRPNANLYIVVKGRLSFEVVTEPAKILRTKTFSTEIGYFRIKGDALEHVYGAHFDIDEGTIGHPVFHSQMRPKLELLVGLKARHSYQGEPENFVKQILRNVRIPSAQMDVFSVITQICADHLIYKDSGNEAQDAFRRVRESCNFFAGAAHRMDYLKEEPGRSCYRSTHWYGDTQLNKGNSNGRFS